VAGFSSLLRRALAERLARGESRAFATAELRGLPMDEASRMARASESGFDTDVYHGTRFNVDAFDRRGMSQEAGFGTHVGTPDQAEDIVRARGIEARHTGEFSVGANVMPMKTRAKNFLRLEDDKTWTPDQMASQLAWLDEPIHVKWRDPFNKTPEDVRRAIQEAGYDGIVYTNKFERPGVDSHIVFEPSDLRSRFAAFDPSRSQSGNILAGLAVAAPTATLSLREALRDSGA